MSIYTNFHTHCRYCDGKGEPEDFVKHAIELGMKAIGFSSHGTLPWQSTWNIKHEDVDAYVDEINNLKLKYENNIAVFLGMEIDFLEGIQGPKSEYFQKLNLDYTIGSVHYIGQLADGTHWTIDSSEPTFSKGVNELFGGSVEKLSQRFFELITKMVHTSKPDIVAHFDLIKKNNKGKVLFDDNEAWYQKHALAALDAAIDVGCIIECNTGGLIRGRSDELYPADFLLLRIKERNATMMLNSDAHKPDQLIGYFDYAEKHLTDLGIKNILLKHEDIIKR